MQFLPILRMEENLHHLRNPGMVIPLQTQQTIASHGFKVVQDVVHPQYVVYPKY